jgi:hypothetical protein
MNRGAENTVTRRKLAPRVPVTIRLPKDVVQKIDLDLESRSVPVSRNNWLLEAVIEKLKRNGSGKDHGTK